MVETSRADREIGCGVPHLALGPIVDNRGPSPNATIAPTYTESLAFRLLAMSPQDFDPGQLSESQQLALGTYTSVTNQEPSTAISLLQRSEWNVEVCQCREGSGMLLNSS